MFLETFFVVVVFVVLVAGPFVLGRRLNNTSGDGSPAPKLLAARTPLFDMGAGWGTWFGYSVRMNKSEDTKRRSAQQRREDEDPFQLFARFASNSNSILVSVEHSPHSRCRNPRPQSPRS
jgi:hypothetical protein